MSLLKNLGKYKNINEAGTGRKERGINALIALNYDLKSWKIVNYAWGITNSNNIDDCNSATAELFPDSLLESKEYDEDDFE
ncbi:hypothetical protein ACIQ57_17050 [Lysinibacillus xylanilyticus]|uniref:hypothetical protein n=1 Tax=Lysinibacillus xylanilyticus TaxID=582475 RepID=UPI00381FB91B